MKKIAFWALVILAPCFAYAEELTENVNSEKVASVPRAKSNAEATASAPNETVTAVPNPNAGKFWGMLDIRPSISTKSGILGSENTIEAGYQFNPTWRMTYTQWFNTTKNLSEGAYAHDGFVRVRGANLYSDGVMTISYQGRLFLPTYATRRDAGFVTAAFNQAQVAFQLSPDLSLSFSTAPTYKHYSRTSTNGKINPVFENQALANLDIKLSSRLLVSLPLYLISTKNHTQGGIKGSGDWNHMIVVWPELDFTINANHMIGLSYYSDNLMDPTLSKFNVAQGLENGVLQAFWTVRI